ncbi:MAG: sulfurtransferase [Rhodospirillum sp.]|nr:sulfurtransferase [Rhodospirillum sp.]MCF8487791.1 sulfurtransferase [Rhodospirillum sp.]MCF8502232.1 sulfurtransferase [Rhodospirillum sp.]
MTYANPDALVSTAWLEEHLGAPDVRVVDATYFMPSSGRSMQAEFEASHIPGAVHFDIDAVADKTKTKAHALPTAEIFSSACRSLGLGDGQRIVVYDKNGGAMAAARVWWLMRLFGHGEVSLLDGGFGAWVSEGRPVDDLPRAPSRRHFTARVNTTLSRDAEQVRATIGGGGELVVDARSAGRFNAIDPEPWEVPRSGRIPGSVNLPFGALQTGDHGRFADAATLKATFETAGVDLDRPLIASCGSGVTACILALGAYLIGKEDVAIYDGSWVEWASLTEYPIER